MSKKIKTGPGDVLPGPYPQTFDLRQYNIDSTVKLHLSKVFSSAEDEGRLPPANLVVSGDANVEVLYLSSSAIGIEYAVVEGLSNLRELHVCPGADPSGSEELTWLICSSLPRLEKITVAGGLRWLQVEHMAALRTIDARKARRLDHFSIQDAPSLAKVNIAGCKKLRAIAGLSIDIRDRLAIDSQIAKNQATSRHDGRLYREMTFTDVDTVLTLINRSAKIATRNGLLDHDFCYGQEDNSNFQSYSFALLRPLEHVYTGGSGEIYAYEFLAHDFFEGKIGIWNSMGNSTQEYCLKEALSTMDDLGLQVPGIRRPTYSQTLDYLRSLLVDP